MATTKGSGWFAPLEGKGYAARLRAVRMRSGCYAIRERTLFGAWEVRYVGESHTGRLYQTATRHFQNWSRSNRGMFWERARGPIHSYSPSECEVQVWPCLVPEVGKLQARLIARLGPSDNVLTPVPF